MVIQINYILLIGAIVHSILLGGGSTYSLSFAYEFYELLPDCNTYTLECIDACVNHIVQMLFRFVVL